MLVTPERPARFELKAGHKLQLVGGSTCTATVDRFDADNKWLDSASLIAGQQILLGEYTQDCIFTINATYGSVDYVIKEDVLQANQSPAGSIITDWNDGVLTKLSSISGESVALDTTKLLDGKPTLKCVVANGTFTAQLALTTPVYLGSLKALQIPILTTWNGKNGSGSLPIQIWLETASAKQIRLSFSFSKPSGRWQTLNILRAAMTSFGGTADATTLSAEAITKVKVLVITGSADSASYPFWLGAVKQDSKGSKAKIVLSFDKCSANQFTYLRPLLRSYGFRANLALITQPNDANGMTEAQLFKMYDDGNEIIHHTGVDTSTPGVGWDNTTKYPTGGTATALIAADIQVTNDYLALKGLGRGIGHAVMGFTAAFANTVAMLRQQEIIAALKLSGIKSVRSGVPTLLTTGAPITNSANLGVYDPYCLGGGTFLTPTLVAQDIYNIIDQAVLYRDYAFIAGHDFVPSGAASNQHNIAEAEAWMAYLKTKVDAGLVDVVVQSELVDYLDTYNAQTE